jgi:hypothetical protein
MNPETNQTALVSQNLQNVPPQLNVVNNQLNYIPQAEEARIKEALRSTSQYIRCLSCQYAGLTTVERSFNCANCCCATLLTPLTWLCYQACRVKDINCFDAKHTCSKCGGKLGEYTAC